MKLSKQTIDLLKVFNTINASILLKEGNVIATTNDSKTYGAGAEVEENFPQDFVLFDLNQFNQLISLMKDPELEFNGDELVIREGRESTTLTNGRVDRIITPKNYKVPVIPADKVDVSFTLTKAQFVLIRKATQALGIRTIEFKTAMDEETISVRAIDQKCPNSNKFDIDSIGSIESGTEFNFAFLIDNWTMTPDDYDVTINRGGVAVFKSKENTASFMIAVEKQSCVFKQQ